MAPPRIKHKIKNPVQTAVGSWLDSLPPAVLQSVADQVRSADPNASGNPKQVLVDCAPKRWVVYEPMVLLPSGSFSAPVWQALLASPMPPKEPLWTAILRQLSPPRGAPLTHLAINEGIPLRLRHETRQTEGEENLLRAPTHLRPLYGFPASIASTTSPSPADLAAALWVSTKQNGLVQTWAPQHTMFSRGNVKEKARLLAFRERHAQLQAQAQSTPSQSSLQTTAASSTSSTAPPPPQPIPLTQNKWAVDLYAGIGYFAFCYAALGLRVLCWELSPWSVEGLRRGAAANGFSVRVFSPSSFPTSSPQQPSSSFPQPSTTTNPPPARSSSPSAPTSPTNPTPTPTPPLPDLNPDDDDPSPSLTATLNAELTSPTGAQIIVLHESNAHAAARLRRLSRPLEVLHVHCGFLPTSRPVWRDAVEMVAAGIHHTPGAGGHRGGWLHLHENVGVEELRGVVSKGAVEGEGVRMEGEGPRMVFNEGEGVAMLSLTPSRPEAVSGPESAAAVRPVREEGLAEEDLADKFLAEKLLAKKLQAQKPQAPPPPSLKPAQFLPPTAPGPRDIAIEDARERKDEVQQLLGEWMGDRGKAEVEHVELVKTYAPGVWHCVFDVFITGD